MENNILPLLVAKVVTMKCGLRMRAKCSLRMRAKCKGLNIRHDLIKLLEENRGKTFSDINCTNVLLCWFPKTIEIKTKINKWDLIKLKSFSTAKEIINKMKRQPSEWEKIIANEATDKGLTSKIYKQLIQLNTRKTNNPIKK